MKRMNMLTYGKYTAGWLDSSIRDFLEMLPEASKSTAFALVTCLDSNTDLHSLLKNSPELRSVMKMKEGKRLGSGLLFPSPLLRSVGDQLFFGFDELWLFPTDKIEPKPESAWIVGPNRIDRNKLDKLGRWMSENKCSMGLGDGDGLNVIVKAQGLVQYLVAQSLSQPEPPPQRNEFVRQDA